MPSQQEGPGFKSIAVAFAPLPLTVQTLAHGVGLIGDSKLPEWLSVSLTEPCDRLVTCPDCTHLPSL